MKYLFPIALSVFLLSCRKCKHAPVLSLQDSSWQLHFKNNSTFTFYAEAMLYFRADDSVFDYRNFDTLKGRWRQDQNQVYMNFNNGDAYSGTIQTADSLSGTLTASGNNGDWYALKK